MCKATSCCDCQLLFYVTLGAGRGVESHSNSIRSPFLEVTLWMQSAGTELCTEVACDFVCQNRNPGSCVRDKILLNKRHPDQVSNDCDSALFEELYDHHWVSGFSPRGLRGVKKMICRPSLFCFPPAMSPFWRIDWVLKEQPLWKNKPLPIVRSSIYPINSGSIGIPPEFLELLESKPRNLVNPHNTQFLTCCFLHDQ